LTIDAPTLLHAAALAAGAQQYPAGALYVVATPIGNLADLSLRGAHASGDDGPATVARLQQTWGGPQPVLWVSAEPPSSALRAQLPPGAVVETKPLSPARLRAWLETLAPEA
jgi:hypothetical protein